MISFEDFRRDFQNQVLGITTAIELYAPGAVLGGDGELVKITHTMAAQWADERFVKDSPARHACKQALISAVGSVRLRQVARRGQRVGPSLWEWTDGAERPRTFITNTRLSATDIPAIITKEAQQFYGYWERHIQREYRPVRADGGAGEGADPDSGVRESRAQAG